MDNLGPLDVRPGLGKELSEWQESLVSKRSSWETQWQDFRLLVRPDTADFKGERMAGLTRNDYIYDDTPCHALETLVNGLDSNLTSQFAAWFSYRSNDQKANKDPNALLWYDHASDYGYNLLSNPDCLFPSNNNETLSELCTFGTGTMFMDRDYVKGIIRFRAYALANCYLEESAEGMVDVCFRKFKRTTRQAIQQFGIQNLPKKIAESKDRGAEWWFTHAVYPRTDRDPLDPRAKNMEIASVIFYPDSGEVIRESGYKTFPYLIPRWKKLAGEVYGRSPVYNCIQNIRMLNALQRVTIQAASLAAMPPVMMENEDWSTPFEWRPGSVIYGDPGSQMPKPIEIASQPQLAQELIQFHQNAVKKAMFNDLFGAEDYGNRERVTATEDNNKKDIKMQSIGPMVGRLTTEYLNPMHQEILKFGELTGQISPRPPSLRGKNLTVFYSSPAARAQRMDKAGRINALVGTVAPWIQYDPSIADGMDLAKATKKLAMALEVDPEIIRSDAQIHQIQQDRQAQQQQANYAKMAQSVAGALKDTATAAATTPSVVGLPPNG